MTATLSTPTVPPPFRAVAVAGAAWPAALEAAAAGAEPGTVVWDDRPDRSAIAVLLAPDRPLAACLTPVLRMTALAALDALAALGPPSLPLAIAPPDRIEVDEAVVGGVRVGAPSGTAPDAVPEWLAVGAEFVLLPPDPEAPGRDPWRTALREEGFGDVTAADLVEAFCRRLLGRVNAWEAGRGAAIDREWHARTTIGTADALSAARRARGLDAGPGRDAASCLAGPSWAEALR